jgi:hypothetical protein
LTVHKSSKFLIRLSNWPSPTLSSTTLQNFLRISHLLSELSQFQHHTKMCPKCSNLLVSSWNLSPVCCSKEPNSC